MQGGGYVSRSNKKKMTPDSNSVLFINISEMFFEWLPAELLHKVCCLTIK